MLWTVALLLAHKQATHWLHISPIFSKDGHDVRIKFFDFKLLCIGKCCNRIAGFSQAQPVVYPVATTPQIVSGQSSLKPSQQCPRPRGTCRTALSNRGWRHWRKAAWWQKCSYSGHLEHSQLVCDFLPTVGTGKDHETGKLWRQFWATEVCSMTRTGAQR
jgi:hypothetical protein